MNNNFEMTLPQLINREPEEIKMVRSNRLYVTGEAEITDWCFNKGTIEMKPFYVDIEGLTTHEEIIEAIKPLLNDNGFGCQELHGADCNVYVIYETTECGLSNPIRSLVENIHIDM